MFDSLDNFLRQSAALLLACALCMASGCAAVDPGPRCNCQQCQGQQPLPSGQGNVNMLGQFTNNFHNLVIGSDAEPQVPRPKRQVASGKSARPETPSVAKAKQVAMTTESIATEVVVAPAAPLAPPASAPPNEYVTLDGCGCGPAPLVAGPAGRFFPVPARPVFSPQYGPQYGGCELR